MNSQLLCKELKLHFMQYFEFVVVILIVYNHSTCIVMVSVVCQLSETV